MCKEFSTLTDHPKASSKAQPTLFDCFDCHWIQYPIMILIKPVATQALNSSNFYNDVQVLHHVSELTINKFSPIIIQKCVRKTKVGSQESGHRTNSFFAFNSCCYTIPCIAWSILYSTLFPQIFFISMAIVSLNQEDKGKPTMGFGSTFF